MVSWKECRVSNKVAKSDAEWRAELTPEQFRVMREKGTETPHTGQYVQTTDTGIYRCAGCGAPLFESETKFEAHCGWPSFTTPVEPEAIIESDDRSHGMHRTEVRCANCDAHLGHVFSDGPGPNELRYCINSVSLELEPVKGA